MVPPNNRQARIDHGILCCRTLCGIEATLGINGAGGTGGICSDAGCMGCLQLMFLVGQQLGMSIGAGMTEATRCRCGGAYGLGSACGVGPACGVGSAWRGAPHTGWAP